MCEFRSAALSDLSEVAQWVACPAQARIWAGARVTYPIDEERLPQQIQWQEARSFCLSEDERLIGFGQIVPKPAGRLHLARLIVSPTHRGRGYGRSLAISLVEQALAGSPNVISLNVFPDNAAAVELYRRIGFVAAEPESGDTLSQTLYMVYQT